MGWESDRRICPGFLTPSSRRGLRSAQELACSSQSNSLRGTGGGSASRVIANRRSTAPPSASSCHFIQPTNDLESIPVPGKHAISIAHPGLCYFPHAHPQCCPCLPATLVAMCRSSQGQDTARVPFAHLIVLFQILHYRATTRGLQNFFRNTSCSIVLSSVSSATSCFSFVFSSRSCLT